MATYDIEDLEVEDVEGSEDYMDNQYEEEEYEEVREFGPYDHNAAEEKWKDLDFEQLVEQMSLYVSNAKKFFFSKTKRVVNGHDVDTLVQFMQEKFPDEFIKSKGAAEFSKLLINAVHYISFEIACIQRKYNLKNPEHRVRFATEAAETLAKLDSEIERNVYLGEVSRVTGVEEEAIRSEIRKLMRKEDEAFRKEAEKRQQNLKNYTAEGRKVEKGLIEAQRNLLYFASQQQGVYQILKDVLEDDDFTEDAFRKGFHHIGELWSSSGHVFPADLVSRFEETKEQKMVTEIFAVQLPTENGADMEKAINEQVRLLKRTKIDHLTATAATVEDIQRMVEARKKLESLYITI